MSAFIPGTYQLIKSDKFDEYMQDVGVGFMTRKVASTLKPATEITQNGDEYTIRTTSTFKNTEIKFKLGEQFNEETADGRKCLSTIVLENDSKMKHTQICDGKNLIMYREFDDKGMTLTLHGPTVVSTRIYERKKQLNVSQ